MRRFFYDTRYNRLIMIRLLVLLWLCIIWLPAQAEKRIISTSGLSGTLLLPDHPANVSNMKVVLIVAGSGAVDRDGNVAHLKNNSLKYLAEGLAEKGIASLRYDKRGVADSAAVMMPEKDLRFANNVNDMLDWYDLLEKDGRFSGIILLGHSEGALVATLAAQKVQEQKKTKLQGIILLTAAGSPAAEILKAQLIAAELPHNMLQKALAILQHLQRGEKTAIVPPELNALFRLSVQDYVISWFAIDPVKELARVTVPVMIVSGGQDIQVPTAEAKKLAAVGANQWVHIEDMNHILKSTDGDRVQNLASYTDPNLKLVPELLPALSEFIQKQYQSGFK